MVMQRGVQDRLQGYNKEELHIWLVQPVKTAGCFLRLVWLGRLKWWCRGCFRPQGYNKKELHFGLVQPLGLLSASPMFRCNYSLVIVLHAEHEGAGD